MDDPLDDLVFRYLERVDAGEPHAAVLAELAAAHPARADALRRGVELLQRTQLHPVPAPPEPAGRFGPFRLLRRLGQGGMGVVYVAEQERPRRRVALKLVRPDQLHFDGARERFEREVESVARLSHPGIAAVLELGEEGGVPWFSQELVVGMPLSELLAALPPHALEGLRASDAREALAAHLAAAGEVLPARAWDERAFEVSWCELALRVARQVAEALQHAHERGVLHRDVKPANVVLTPGGRAVLVDFGLASLRGTTKLTRTGTQLGSLHYMPPEQVDGRGELDPRADVYSLGVTLYELLTLRAPYRSDSLERLRGLILRGEAPPPRRLNRAVTRDASVVCAKAMERAPARRYASAAAFADDLGAALAHRTIAARPAGPLLRVARWTRRHPAGAVSAVAGFLLLVVAPLAFGLQAALAARRLAAVNEDLEAGNAARERANRELARLNAELEGALRASEANLAGATDAIERVMRWSADEGLDDVPGMLALRSQVIDEALEVFAGLRATRADDDALALQEAGLWRTKGAIERDLARRAASGAALERALAILAPRVAADDAPTDWLVEHGMASHEYAQGLRTERRFAEALPHYRAALASLRRVAEREPGSFHRLADVAQVAADSAMASRVELGDTPEVRGLYDEAVRIAARLVELRPDSEVTHRVATSAHGERALFLAASGRNDEARRDFEAAAAAAARAIELEPGDRELRWNRANSSEQLGWFLLMVRRDPDAAEPHLVRALAIYEQLARENPGLLEFEDDGFDVRGILSELKRRRGDTRGAYEALLPLVARRRARADAEPGALDLQLQAGAELINLANRALTDETRGEARFALVREHCQEAGRFLARLPATGSGARELDGVRAHLYYNRGSAEGRCGDLDALFATLDAFQALEPHEPVPRLQLACLWARAYELEGDPAAREEALGWLEAAVEAGFADAALLAEAELIEELDCARADELERVVRARAQAE